ncbi:unnamed protein product [Brassica rapa subsp. narinosa]
MEEEEVILVIRIRTKVHMEIKVIRTVSSRGIFSLWHLRQGNVNELKLLKKVDKVYKLKQALYRLEKDMFFLEHGFKRCESKATLCEKTRWSLCMSKEVCC